MFSSRRKPPSDTVTILSHYRYLLTVDDLTRVQAHILTVVHAIRVHLNEFADVDTVKQVGMYGRKSAQLELDNLKRKGYLDSHSYNSFFLTSKGEYVIRGIQIKASRLIEDSKLSKWKRIKKGVGDPREKYLMPPAKGKLY